MKPMCQIADPAAKTRDNASVTSPLWNLLRLQQVTAVRVHLRSPPRVPGLCVQDFVFVGKVLLVIVSAVEDHVAVGAVQIEAGTFALAAVAHQVAIVGEHLGAHVASILVPPITGHHFVARHGVAPTLA